MKRIAIILAILGILLGACSPATLQPTPTNTPLPPTATLPPATATFTPLPPTETPLPPTATPELVQALPTETPQPAAPAAPTATLSPENAILVYYIRDNSVVPTPKKGNKEKGDKSNKGSASCSFEVVYLNTGMPRTGDVATDVKTALGRLFGFHSKTIGALSNPIYASTFQVVSVTFKENQGLVNVELMGTYGRSGVSCDNSKVREQVWATIRQFPGVKTVYITVNGNLLGDILAVDK